VDDWSQRRERRYYLRRRVRQCDPHLSPSSSIINSDRAFCPAWIFQVDGTFTIAAGKSIALTSGALPENIVWVVADAVTFGAGAHFEGILLGKTAVTLQTGTTANGRVLAQTFVALQQATIVAP
jgi:hypothetical protein